MIHGRILIVSLFLEFFISYHFMINQKIRVIQAQIISTDWSSLHLISYLLVSWRKILGDAQAESNIFLQLTNEYDIRCEEDQ